MVCEWSVNPLSAESSCALGPAASPRFQFKVATLEQADAPVRGRGKAFAGSGFVLSEVLSPAERALHTQLFSFDFLRLKDTGGSSARRGSLSMASFGRRRGTPQLPSRTPNAVLHTEDPWL